MTSLRMWIALAMLLSAAGALSLWICGGTYRQGIDVDVGVTLILPLLRQMDAWPTEAEGVTSVGLAGDVRFTIPSSERVELAPIYGDPEGLWRVCVVRAELATTDCADACDMIAGWLELARKSRFDENGAPVRVRPRCGCEAASCIEDVDTRRGDLRARFQIVSHPGSDGSPERCRVEVALGNVGYDSCRVTFINNAREVPRSYRRFGIDSHWVR